MKKKAFIPVLLALGSLVCLTGLGIFIGKRSLRTEREVSALSERSQQAAASLQTVLGTADADITDILIYETDALSGETDVLLSETDVLSDASDIDTDVSAYEDETDELLDETEGYSDEDSLTARILNQNEAVSYRLEDYPIPDDHQLIFVGDSRTVGAGRAEAEFDDPCLFIGETGEGYTWFAETGMAAMEEAIRSLPGVPVVFNLGVNDCDAVEAYIALYQDIMAAYPDTEFYFMSVNPVTEESVHVPDSDVRSFNSRLKAAFRDQYIDTYTWMTLYGFVSVDGVHYSEEQYCAIHDYAVRAVYGLEQPQTGLTEAVTEEMT